MSWFTHLFRILFGQKQEKPTAASLPPYIEYGGNIVLPAPDSLSKSLMYCFFFTSNGGDKSLLQNLLDERLNFPAGSNYRYEALVADVLITFAATNQDRSIPKRDLGFVAENEVVCWVPAMEKIKRNGRWVANRIVWFIPYIVVDNVWALAAGREIFGLPKTLGQFNIPSQPEQAQSFTSTTAGFQTFGFESQLKEYPFLSIARQNDTSGQAGAFTPFKDGRHALEILKEIFLAAKGFLDDFSLRMCLHEIEDMIEMRLFWVMLKQFRSIEDSTSACYQAIVEGPLHISAFHGGGLMHHAYQLQINNLESMPVAKELGLESGQTARAALWLDFDFTAKTGRTLWKA